MHECRSRRKGLSSVEGKSVSQCVWILESSQAKITGTKEAEWLPCPPPQQVIQRVKLKRSGNHSEESSL